MQELNTDEEKISYAIGLDMGESLEQIKSELEVPSLLAGIEAMMTGAEPLLDKAQANEIKQQYAGRLQAAQQKARGEQAQRNLEAGTAFLAEMDARDGVAKTDSGLRYLVLQEGGGDRPGPSDSVVVHYTGALIDGQIFDSSVQRGEPATFPVDRVIAGWTEALQLMTVGSRYQVFIPPDLAYGADGTGGPIGPNETLVFEVELLEIVGQ